MLIKSTSIIKDDYNEVQALRKSFLSDFSISPAHAFVRKETKCLTDGVLFHEIVLEPDVFLDKYVITDLNLATNDGRRFKEENNERIIIKKKDVEKFYKMAENLLSCVDYVPNEETFENIINNGTVEQGILAECELDGIEFGLKVKPDIVYETDEKIYCYDLKTVDNANLGLFQKNAKFFKYHWQDYLYSEVLKAHYGKPVDFIFVLVEKSAPHGVHKVTIKPFENVNVGVTRWRYEIEECITKYHAWLFDGGDTSKCYDQDVIEEVYI